jgi:transposase
VSAVARRHGLTPQQLFGWRRDARERSTRRQSAGAEGMSFAPVLMETASPAGGPPATTSCAIAGGTVEIVFGTAVVRVGPGTNMALLTKVLRAVKAAT